MRLKQDENKDSMKYFYTLLLVGFIGLCNFVAHAQVATFNHHSHGTLQAPSNCISSPDPVTVIQTNGKPITIVGKGNMTNSWTETTDGYTIIPVNGNYQYAQKINGELQPTGVFANDISTRSMVEMNYVASLQRSIKPDFDPLKSSILNQVNAQLSNKTYPTSGNLKILAILIDYPDLQSQFVKSSFDSLLMANNYRNGDGSFKTFYHTASNGNVTIDVDVMGWYRAANNYRYYGRDSGYARAADLAREAVNAADAAGANFANYDNDNDGDVDGILVVHAGPGAEQGSRTQYIWSHRWVMAGGNLGAVTLDGKFINDYMMNPETRISGASQNLVGIGVFCHEFGHNLGLPDLYDTDPSNGDSEGIGNWCLMAGGGWLGGEHRPVNFSAWCKVENGWDTPKTRMIGTSMSDSLSAASTTHNEIIQINTSVASEYFLIENRQKTGLDRELPGTGLAIWHINTTKTNAFGNSVNADENLKGVDLEEADGNNDLDNEVNRGDGGDLFPGNSNNNTFDDNTIPNARTYNLATTGLQIRNITETNSKVFFDLGPQPAAASCSGGTTTLTAASGSFSDGSGPSNYTNNLNCSWLIQPVGVSTITLSFTSLATEINADFVNIYDGANNSAPLLASYSGTNNLNSTTSTGGVMFVEFVTDATGVDAGWDATYTTSAGGPGCSGSTTLTANVGSFSDGSGVNDYDNNQFCSWLIQPTSGTITLNFTAFDTEANVDRVLIFDGADNTATQIANYSGSSIPASVTSSTNSLYIEFRTNGTVVAQGWDANYTVNTVATPTCSGTTNLTATTGTFDDGSGANVDYSDNLNCSWLIDVTTAQVIEVAFDSLDIDGSDTLYVYDGNSSSATLIGKYTGATVPSTILSSGNSVFVEFITDAANTDKGWQLSYEGLDGCSGRRTLTAASGTFSDGSAASANYLDNSTCEWLIQPAGANFIQLNFTRFATEITFDVVTIYDGPTTSSTLLGTYSGINLPPTINSSGGSLLVRFTSDFTSNDRGFEANYVSSNSFCLPNRTLTNASGTFTDGSGANNYENNSNCSWLIQPPRATNITLTFSVFDLELTNDVVNLYDGTDNTGTLIGSYSGPTAPPVASINGTNKSLFLEFITDGQNTAQGFAASYTSTSAASCSGTVNLTAPSGTVADGSGTGLYDNNRNCGWLIQPPGTPTSITFTMNNLALANFGDRVRIYDGTSNTGTLLRSYFGSFTGGPVTAFSGAMFIEFVTDASIQGQGWDGVYTSSSTYCSPQTTFTGNTGFFTDGSPFNQDYLDNTDCEWLISPTASNVAVALRFFQFDTEAGNDTVTIYDGTTTSDPVLATLSGTPNPLPTVTSTGGDMLITFKTNGSVTADGWRASYSTQPIPFCGGTTTLTSATGTFDDGSPATSNYVENSNCQWLIQPAGANVVSLSFNRFATQATADIVSVYDGTSNSAPLIGNYSGSSIPPTIVSSNGGSLFVEFTSNGFLNDLGWEATYTSSTNQCLSNVSVTAISDTIKDGSGANNYANNQNCSWIIQPPTATSIDLNFLNFDLNNPGDSVKVYDGTNASAPLLAALSGSTVPANVLSTGGTMYIEFITDGSAVAQGFEAVYTITSSLSCIGTTTLTAPSGTVVDGSGTAVYDNNLNCGWSIQPPGNPASITFTMNSLALANFGDLVRVYDGIDNTGQLLRTYFGTNTGPPVTAFSGNMFIEFTTDGNQQAQGWSGTYSSSASYCSPNTTLTANNGFFTDGSPFNQDYLDNTDCEWLIQPTATNVAIALRFFQFDTEFGNDTVTIYDGATTADPILATLSGTITNPQTITSSGGDMLVTFKSNGSVTADGWRASYVTQQIPYCAGLTTLTAANGSFDDGSPANLDYVENSNCQWLIQPTAGAISIDLTFSRFNTEFNDDVVQVFDGATTSDPVLGTFSGNNIPPTLTATGNSMLVTFSSDNFFEERGWAASYTSSNTVTLDALSDTVFINAAAGSTASFGLNSNTTWQTTDNAAWLIPSPFNGSGNATINLLAFQPNIGPQRTAEVYINATTGTQKDTVVVIQRASGNFMDITPDTLFFAANPAGTQSATVVSSVSWSATTSSGWITANPLSGTNNGSVTISPAINTSTNDRLGFVVFSGNLGVSNDTVYVRQAGAIPPPPSLSVNPSNITLASPSGSADMFTVNSTVQWQTASGALWLNVINPANTTDTNTVMINAASANNTGSPRSTFVAVQDVGGTLFDTVFVTQQGNTLIIVTSPDTVTLMGSSGSAGVGNIVANTNWTISKGASWFDATPISGTGNDNLTFTANSDNNTGASRISFVSYEDPANNLFDTVVVIQNALPTSLNLSVSPKTITLSNQANSSDKFTVNSNVNWQVSIGGNFLTVAPIPSPMDTADVNVIAITANSSTQPRDGFIAVQDLAGTLFDTVFVSQLGTTPSLTLSADTLRLSSTVGSSANADVIGNVNWTSLDGATWFQSSPNSGTTGTTNVSVTAQSTNSTGTDRISYVAFSSGTLVDTLVVIQDGQLNQLSANPSALSLGFQANSSSSFDINSNVSWTISNPVSWLNVAPTSGTNNGTINVTANSDNLSGADRVANLTVSGGGQTLNVTITQIDGSTQSFSLSVDTLFVDNPQGSTGTFFVNSNVNGWSLSENTSWILVNPTSGNNTEQITVLAATRNNFGNPRFAEIVASAPNFNNDTLIVAQKEATPLFQVSPNIVVLGPDSLDETFFNISSNLISWTVQENSSWMNTSVTAGQFTQRVKITALDSNTTGNVRKDSIFVIAPPLVPEIIEVTQDTVQVIGIAENIKNIKLDIYPNPNRGEFIIEGIQMGSDKQIRIIDMLGNLVNYSITESSYKRVAFDLGNVAEGIYFIEIISDQQRISRKISVIH